MPERRRVSNRGNYVDLGLTASLILFAVAGPAQTQSPAANAVGPKDTLVYVGTRGERGNGHPSFSACSPRAPRCSRTSRSCLWGWPPRRRTRPFFELDTRRRRLFTVNEVEEFEGQPSGAVSAYAIDDAGKLTLVNQRASMGTRPCHLSLDKDARHVLVANCGAGTHRRVPHRRRRPAGRRRPTPKNRRANRTCASRSIQPAALRSSAMPGLTGSRPTVSTPSAVNSPSPRLPRSRSSPAPVRAA